MISLSITGLWYPLQNYFPGLRGRVSVVAPEPLLTADPAWIGPAEAAARAATQAQERGEPEPTGIHSIRLYTLAGRPVYEVETNGQRRYWVRAEDGSTVAFTVEDARALVAHRYGLDLERLEGALQERRSLKYWGDVGIPAYVFYESDAPGTVYAVQPRNGVMATSTHRSRISQVLMRAHTFWPLGEVTHREVERGVLVLSGLLSLALGITGYFLLFPLRFRRRSK